MKPFRLTDPSRQYCCFIQDCCFIALLFAFFCLLAFFIYYPGANGPMLLDDNANIVFNDGIKITRLDKDSLYQAATSMNDSFSSDRPALTHRPISYISFALNHYLASDFFVSLKLTNIVIHIANGLLLFIVCFQLTGRFLSRETDSCHLRHWLPLLVSVGWLLHPLMVSTVLYSVQRMTMLSAFFTLAGVIVFIYYRKKLLSSGSGFWCGLSSVSFFTVMAALSKENGALTTTFCLVIELCFFRFRFYHAVSQLTRRSYALILCLPTLLLVIYLTLTYFTSSNHSLSDYRHFDYDMRFLTQFRVLFSYLYWFIFPSPDNLTFIHDTFVPSRNLFSPMTTLVACVGWVAIVVTAIYLVIKNKLIWLAFGVLWFVCGHLIESTVLPLELVFEHRNYLPYAGLVFSLVYFLPWLVGRFSFSRAFRLILPLFLIVCIPAVLSARRVTDWQSEELLLAHWHTVNKNSPRVWAQTADYYMSRDHNIGAAYAALEKAFRLDPAEAGYGLAQIAIICSTPESFMLEEVLAITRRTSDALMQPPTTAYTINQYGNLLNLCSDLSQIRQFKDIHEKAARLNRGNISPLAHYMLAVMALAYILV